MHRTAILVASLALAIVALSPASAGAGVNTLTISATCDTATGEYDVTYDLTNVAGTPGTLTVLAYEVDGVGATAPTFSPNPVAGPGSSSAADSVPGSTTLIYIEVQIDYGEGATTVGSREALAGDCVATTTTTASTTSTSTTSTTTPAPAVAVAPTFTG